MVEFLPSSDPDSGFLLPSFLPGAGEAGARKGGDDPTASVSVHHPAARDGHVQPEREFSVDPVCIGVCEPTFRSFSSAVATSSGTFDFNLTSKNETCAFSQAQNPLVTFKQEGTKSADFCFLHKLPS